MTTECNHRRHELSGPALRTLGAAMAGLALGSGPLLLGSFSVFLRPIAAEFHWSRAAVASGVSGLMAAASLASPFWGYLADRLGARRVVVVQTVAFGLSLALLCAAPAIHALYFAAFALAGAVMPNMVVYSRGVAGWFARRRGLAFGLLVVALDLALLAAPPIAQLLLGLTGWRGAYLVFSAVALALALPLVAILFRPPIERSSADGPGPARRGASTAAALSSGTFWLLVLGQGLSTVVYSGFSTHVVAFIEGQGFGAATALTFASTLSLGSMAAQLTTGWLFDRLDTPKVVLPFALLAFLGLVLAHYSKAPVIMIGAAFLFGLGAGGEMSTTSYYVTRYFGLRNYTQIAAWIAPFKIPLTFAPMVIGMIYDHDHSYGRALGLLEGLLLLSALLFALLPPYRFARSAADPD